LFIVQFALVIAYTEKGNKKIMGRVETLLQTAGRKPMKLSEYEMIML
jgi:hypothetical protein